MISSAAIAAGPRPGYGPQKMGSGVSLVALSSPSPSNSEESHSVISAGKKGVAVCFSSVWHPSHFLTFWSYPQVPHTVFRDFLSPN